MPAVIRLALLAWLLTACNSVPPPEGEPAIIVNPDARSRAELQAVVKTALHGVTVTLSPDALTDSSLLMIDRQAPRGIDAPHAAGRILDPGETFQLLLDGRQCVLRQQSTGLRWLLLDTECAPLPASD